MTRMPLEELLDPLIREGHIAGAAVAAVDADELIERYAGDAAPGLPASQDVLWPLASMSKVYTAATVLRLVELGRLDLDQHVASMLPAFTGDGRDEVRLRDLLRHTSGLPYESAEMDARLASLAPLAELIDEAIREPLLFRPGSGFAYSDYGYLLAGHVAELATDTPFAALMTSLILEPMGLPDTFLEPPRAVQGRIARVRGVLAEDTEGAMYNSAHARSLAHPAFGVVSSLRDVVRFARHFAPRGPRVLGEASVRAMTTSQTGGVPGAHPVPGWARGVTPIDWAFGFMVPSEGVPSLFPAGASARVFGHPGASGCYLAVDPAAERIVAVLTNTHLRTDRDAWYARLLALAQGAWELPDQA